MNKLKLIMATLIIAEKRKAAEAIANALGKVNQIRTSKSVTVFHVVSKDLYVIPLRGHILEYHNTDLFKSWTKSNPRDIITNPNAIEKVPLTYAGPYIKALKDYSKLCDNCIIGTDADAEGCDIGLFDAYPFIKKSNPNIKLNQLWLSSLQKDEIINKFTSLIPPKWDWARSAEARSIIDAIIGFSATRKITRILIPLLKQINLRFTSIGRVQTSLLYLIYLRESRINEFQSEAYFTIEAALLCNGNSFKADHESNPFKKENEENARIIYDKIKDADKAKILNNNKKETYKKPPTPLNTSKALVLITKTLKISATVAFKTLNDLYLNKIISYPRTDSDVYKPDFKHIDILKSFKSHSEYGSYTNNIKKLFPTRGKKDAGDHPPITPLESLELNSSKFENNVQSEVYNLLARHYLALFGEDAKESRTYLKIDIRQEPFKTQITSLLYLGFLEIVPFLKLTYSKVIEIKDEFIPVSKITFNQKETKPPPKYSDTTLLQLMERNNLGTKATRPIIIQILLTRNLISRQGNQYSITKLGDFLINNLKEIWLPFLEPSFTKEIEDLLEEIKDNKKEMEKVIEIIKLRFLALYDKLSEKEKEFHIEIKKSVEDFKQLETKKFPMTTSPCPVCKNHPMKLITTQNKKRFLACSDEKCKNYLSLPKTGSISILTSTCSACGFNIFKIAKYKNRKKIPYYICPNCWTEGFKTKSSKGFCPNCESFKIEKNKCVPK